MFVARRTLPRRVVLRGVGTALALPWLDAMAPALGAARLSAAAPIRRLAVIYVPNGIRVDQWTPVTRRWIRAAAVAEAARPVPRPAAGADGQYERAA